MLRIRIFEDTVSQLFFQNELAGALHLYQGQEAIAVGVCNSLKDNDVVAATYRGHGVALAKGASPASVFAELFGRETGLCGGRAGSMNLIDLEHGLIGCFAIVGGSIGAATGAALAFHVQSKPRVAVAFFGDGATNQAYFHECLNFAAVRQLPVIFVCENNQYGEWTRVEVATAGNQIAARSAAYGMPSDEVDGNDVGAVLEAAREAAERAREGDGPTLIECATYRLGGHSTYDPAHYRPKDELDEWRERDPILRLETTLDSNVAQAIRTTVEQEIAAAVDAARAAPLPDPNAPMSATLERDD